MKLAYSTLGCPDWSLREIVEAALRYGYEAVELRCLRADMDLPARPEFQPGEIAETKRRLTDHGLAICCVDTSCSFHDADPSERRRQIDIALRHAELAAALGAPLIRVFPNEVPPGAPRDGVRRRIAASLRDVAERLPPGVGVALETHADFAAADETVAVVRLADHPSVGIVWDVANTIAAGDTPAAAAAAIAPYLRHVHLRDARPREGERFWLPVLAGRGAVPLAEAVAALRELGYAGFVSFEWEKLWHPELEEPEVAFRDFADAWRAIR